MLPLYKTILERQGEVCSRDAKHSVINNLFLKLVGSVFIFGRLTEIQHAMLFMFLPLILVMAPLKTSCNTAENFSSTHGSLKSKNNEKLPVLKFFVLKSNISKKNLFSTFAVIL